MGQSEWAFQLSFVVKVPSDVEWICTNLNQLELTELEAFLRFNITSNFSQMASRCTSIRNMQFLPSFQSTSNAIFTQIAIFDQLSSKSWFMQISLWITQMEISGLMMNIMETFLLRHHVHEINDRQDETFADKIQVWSHQNILNYQLVIDEPNRCERFSCKRLISAGIFTRSSDTFTHYYGNETP